MKIRLSIILSLVIATIFGLAMPSQLVRADAAVLIDNLQPSWIAPGGGGVYSAYIGPPAYGYVTPGTTALYDGREAGIIKAGLAVDPTSGHYEDEGLFAFIPNVTIDVFAAGTLTYDVVNQEGTNSVWMTIEIDTGVSGDRNDNTVYQFVPTTNPANWHTVNAAAGQWQKWADNNGTVTGPLMSLSDVAAAHTGLTVVRAYLRLGMGDSYHGTGAGTIAWVDKATLGGVTYDFVLPTYWYVAPTGLDTNAGTAASPFLTIQHAIDSANPGDTIHVAEGTFTTPAGGYVVTQPGLTFQLSPGTIIHPSSPCFTISASNTTLIGGICEPSSGSDGLVTGAAINNLVIRGMEIRNGAADGIHLAHDINGLQIVDNYIHDMGGDAVEYASGTTVGGVHEVQGNLFQNNGGSGVNNASANTYHVEYNSWGDYAGPTGANGDGASGLLDVDPWTHVSLSMISSGSPVANRVAVGAQIIYTIRMDARETFGADFKLNFPTANLNVISITGGGSFQQDSNCALSTPAQANAAGMINFCGYRTAALNDQQQTVYTVVFQGVAAGAAALDFDANSDKFAMAPPSGASTNTYAGALTDGSVTVFGAYAVTGRIDLQGRPSDSGAVMSFAAGLNQGYGPYTFTTSDYWGNIGLAAAVQDVYNITVSMPRYLDLTVGSGKSLALAADHTLSTLTLLGGDANDNDVIDISDASIIGGQYGSVGSNGDINNDGTVNIFDLVLAGGNYLKESNTAYASWIP